jgi:hypothetical protein
MFDNPDNSLQPSSLLESSSVPLVFQILYILKTPGDRRSLFINSLKARYFQYSCVMFDSIKTKTWAFLL